MTYKVKSRLDRTKWFDKSFDDINLKTANRWDYYKAWEEKYGYRIQLDKFGWPAYVIFPSQEEATMFLLRWT